MSLSLELTPGYQFPTDGSVDISYDLLNRLAKPTVALIGSIGAASISDNSITTVKLVDGVLSADAAGRAKMADGYLSADATGRAKLGAGFFGAADSTSLALFGSNFLTPAKLDVSAGSVIGATRNLVAQSASASTATIVADEIVLKDASANFYLARSVSLTVNMATSGANGLDTGAEASSTWYYLWAIYNGTTVSGLISTSATAPTMPGGYSFKALIGAVRNDGSSNFITFYQLDREVWLDDVALFAAHAGTLAYTALSGADLTAFQAMVPPIAKKVRGYAGGQASGADACLAVAADASGLGAVAINASHAGGSASVNGYNNSGEFVLPLKTSQNFYSKMDSTGTKYGINITGYAL